MRRKILLIYFLLINIITFLLRGIDKWKAILKKRRISEKILLIFCALGGRLGAILAMEAFRHKTVKGKFLIWFYGIVILWIIGGASLYLLFGK
ncbi:MAG: DUF1294 domain-containing protein [Candidatus Absconditabacteria bacterium]|nr:DUF1294 domain-containing protein [Candidatus Absconditabacteria bacterium]MDD3868113.1 DUF1294 domain-containing protein [Candidatus Absconditabacteria bacterium]MDD4714361.1 DUF1294 domain-containing protein [Candidatus Absconditabacteria bacterium]